MNAPSRWQRLQAIWKSDFLSAKDLAVRALCIAVVFAVAHCAGWREFTSFLSGTMPDSALLGNELAALLGVGYVLLYFAFILLVPILLIAAALLWCWQRVLTKK